MKKYIGVLFLAAFMISGCVSDRVIHDVQLSNLYAIDKGNGVSMDAPANPYIYKDLIYAGYKESCAARTAYTSCDVRMKRNLPHKCHHQILGFNNVRAELIGDSLHIVLKSISKNTAHVFRTIDMNVTDTQADVQILKGEGVSQQVLQPDGSTVMMLPEQSAVTKNEVRLNKEFYAVGDTLYMDVYIESFIHDRKGRMTKEYVKGSVRTIVSTPAEDCQELYGYILR